MVKQERRALQITVGLLSFVPLAAGFAGAVLGTDMLPDAPAASSLDSHFRYLSGLLLAIGLGFVSTIPDIENKTARFRLLTFIVFVGGLARLTGVAFEGVPNPSMLFGLGMELVVTPLLCLWQSRVARSA